MQGLQVHFLFSFSPTFMCELASSTKYFKNTWKHMHWLILMRLAWESVARLSKMDNHKEPKWKPCRLLAGVTCLWTRFFNYLCSSTLDFPAYPMYFNQKEHNNPRSSLNLAQTAHAKPLWLIWFFIPVGSRKWMISDQWCLQVWRW